MFIVILNFGRLLLHTRHRRLPTELVVVEVKLPVHAMGDALQSNVTTGMAHESLEATATRIAHRRPTAPLRNSKTTDSPLVPYNTCYKLRAAVNRKHAIH